MIYQCHLDFKDETLLQTLPQKEAREIIPVRESTQKEISELLPFAYDWITMSGQKARYLSVAPFTTDYHDMSFGLEIKDSLTLAWDKNKKEILYNKKKGYSPEKLQFWLYHTFMPILLELTNIYHILHVGAVEIENRVVLFSGPSFGGKSTMTDYFIKQGHTMLSDDTLAVEEADGKYYAIPSYPFHRPYRKLEDLGYPVEKFATKVKPVNSVYLLNKSDTETEIEIKELKGIEKFKALHYSIFIMFEFMKQERFTFFTKMAKKIPIYEITYPHSLDRLPEVYQKIVEHEISNSKKDMS